MTGGGQHARWLLLALLASLLGACAGRPPAPIEDRAGRETGPPPAQYRVVRGDTLYSIAFRFGLDYRLLAAANRIPPPYTIYIGQDLVMQERALAEPATEPKPAPARPGGAAAKPSSTPAPARPATRPAPTGPVSTWRWPTEGKVVRRYSNTLHKGVDIAGQRGDPVLAAAAGQVVYAGTGIAGYGQLLIIKHNQTLLSAYGHNDALLVQEGQIVAAGEQIARKGSTGTDGVKLHFEIRRGGRPVDPLQLLPKRS